MNEKLIEEIALKYTPDLYEAAADGNGVYALSKKMLREYAAAQNAAGQAPCSPDPLQAGVASQLAPAAPTERRVGEKDRRKDGYKALVRQSWEGAKTRTGPQDRRQAPQPSTAAFSTAPSQEDVGQGGIAGTAQTKLSLNGTDAEYETE